MMIAGLTAGSWTQLVAACVTLLAVVTAILIPRHERRMRGREEASRAAAMVLIEIDDMVENMVYTDLGGDNRLSTGVIVWVKNFSDGPIREVTITVSWESGVSIGSGEKYAFATSATPYNVAKVTLNHLEPSPRHYVPFGARRGDNDEPAVFGWAKVTWFDRWGNECEGAKRETSRVVRWRQRD